MEVGAINLESTWPGRQRHHQSSACRSIITIADRRTQTHSESAATAAAAVASAGPHLYLMDVSAASWQPPADAAA